MEKFKWLNDVSRQFLSRGYLKDGESAEDRIREIADKAEEYLGIEGYADKFYDYMSRGYYSLSSPVWSNYGKERGLPVSCFGSYVDDNMNSIMQGVAENGTLMKNGGGTSGYFGALRGRGAAIKESGQSSGSVHFMQLFDTLASVVSQGSMRRGFFTAYQDADHPDIEEFLEIGTEGNAIQGLTTGVVVSDSFMDGVREGDATKRKVWAKVLQSRSEIGYPYIMFKDNVNNNKPRVYKDKNAEIVASNMCLRGDSEISVLFPFECSDRVYRIEDFVSSFNNNSIPEGTKIKTSEGYRVITNAAIMRETDTFIRVIDANTGKFIECTPDHKIYTHNRGWVEAETLEFEDKLFVDVSTHQPDGTVIEHFSLGKKEPVFDLTVEGVHSFFANDILVHNCNEIFLPQTPEETFTCVLSSINLLHWDEIVKTDAIEVLTYFLDTICTEFVEKTKGRKYFERARQFAERHRAIGLGVLGWHSYLQSKMIPFESNEAGAINISIGHEIRKRTEVASKTLAGIFGEPEMLKGYGFRNTTRTAIAPTKSSSFILGQVSQSIEPEFSNFYVKDLAKIKITVKNPYLEKLLIKKKKNTNDVWESIKNNDGSVQHLDFLTDDEKAVFKTFAEIDPYSIVNQAADRQPFIDQGQSLNLMIDPDMPVKEINRLYFHAWERGIKGLYYSYSMSKAQALTRKKINQEECSACSL